MTMAKPYVLSGTFTFRTVIRLNCPGCMKAHSIPLGDVLLLCLNVSALILGFRVKGEVGSFRL